MSISKKFLKTRPVCKVRFVLPSSQCEGVETVCLVGEFNGWNEQRNPMKRGRDGSFSVEVELETGREYRFRYLLDGCRWANDSDADGYEYCPFANADNALVSV
ncbi:isoamylase early set domain-containing protein [Nitratidesulfovibrio vulgaris]|uniref:Isoamylase N-terminal domain protein n=1 Tax=Nitratidesulfovibrio vulgaris (strain DP4) TaxID=391774 RepID=A0A0H3A9V0_NITV4|nr:isoamylase early set domain-containing protein [Nitratidesulfovibrio vulgaris]ABM29063.1 isoamylase N-terminal domain protein [Nitratidesulfovibrio vulgaris DP4]ADP86031.1 isoamylase protein-like protein [Nitratidesulfovibrio vulgaris RCH1]WCB47585.1 isoamylase early set domain-containing protein [Nitratidesulfovibrio vulgaris]HBW15216.1 glycoside hydrolase [Desulfovibrio sp.]